MKNRQYDIFLVAVSITLLTGLLVIIGWLANSDFLQLLIRGEVKMKFNAALGFTFSSLALLLLYFPGKDDSRKRLAIVLSVLVALIGAITLIEYVFAVNTGIDELFVKDVLPTTPVYYAGRMSPLTAVHFLLIGTGLFLFNKKRTGTYQFLYLSIIAFIALVMLIGLNFIADIPTFVRLAVHSSVCFILLPSAIWFAQPALHKEISFERRMATGFSAVILLIVTISIFSSYYSNRRISTTKLIIHTNNVLREVEQTLSLTKDIESGSRGYIITGDSTYLEPFTAAKNSLPAQIKLVKELTSDNPVQQPHLDSLSVLIAKRIDFSEHCIALKNQKGLEAANQLMNTRLGLFYTEKIRVVAKQIEQVENDLQIVRQKENDKSIASFDRAFMIFLALVFALLLIILISDRNNTRVRKAAEERFKGLLDAAPDAMIISNDSGEMALINQQTEKLFGYTRLELIGKSVELLIPNLFHSRHLGHQENYFAAPQAISTGTEIELFAIRKDGTRFPVEISLSPLQTSEGLLVSASIRDITERKKAEEQIAYMARLMEETSEAIFSTDSSFKLRSWNKAAEKLFGYSSAEVIGKTGSEILNPQIEITTRDQIRKELKEKGFWKGEITYLKKDGTPLDILISNTATRNPDGEILAYVSVCRDISQRKKAEAALSKLNAELEQRVKERTEEVVKSENRFRALIENSDDIIALMDENMTPIYRSPSAERITGFTDEDRKNAKVDELHPNDLEKIKEMLDAIKAAPGKPFAITHRLKHKQGHYIWLEGNFTNLLHDPAVKAIVGNMRDVTERKTAEERLAKTMEEKNIILESIADAFFAVDKEWTVTYWNRIAEEALGVQKQQIVGKKLWDIFSSSVDSHSYKKYNEAVRTNKVIHFEDYYPDLHKWYEISAYPSENGLSVYFKDITERKESEEEIRKLNAGLEETVARRTEELRKANSEMEAFTYSVSHDLRAPLRGIIGFTAILEEDYTSQLDDEAKRITSVIRNNTMKMGHLIDDLLAFSRTGKQELIKTTINTQSMVNEIVKDLSQQNEKNITWKIHDLPPVKADLNTIRQVWINLISNAIKYSGNQQQQAVEIASRLQDHEIIFYVKDNGVGFDEQYKHKLFKVFQRLHSADEFEGTGVGLALVEKIVSRHDGKVWAESKPGEGASFYFSLPN